MVKQPCLFVGPVCLIAASLHLQSYILLCLLHRCSYLLGTVKRMYVVNKFVEPTDNKALFRLGMLHLKSLKVYSR